MKKSVLILGGGIAGLAAARELLRHQISVTVIEAQNRLGGRIHTIHEGSLPIELGAEFIHGESKPLLRTILDAGLTTQAAAVKGRTFENGQFNDINIWDQAEDLFQRINLHEPDLSFEKFLARQTDIEERLKNSMRLFVEGFNAARSNRISAHALLKAEQAAEQMNGSVQLRPTLGYSALVDFLAEEIKKLGGTFRMNAFARQVTWKQNCVDVLIEQDSKKHLLSARAAIVALPLGILKTDEVKFLPPLPTKLEAARGLEFGNVVKVIFQFRDAFWDDFGFIHAVDKPIPTWWNDPRGPLVVGWAAGPYADALLKYSRQQLEELGLDILSDIFSKQKDVLRSQLVASHYLNWADDPHIRGAYSYIPVNGLDLPQQLAAPVGKTLFFAGEATVADAQMGTVFGALETGLRAAREIISPG